MSSNISVIMLCAGKGERMKSDLPKVLHKIAGESMISHVMSSVSNFNISDLVAVINNSQELVKDEVKNIFPEAKFAFQNNPQGTGDAVSIALQEFDNREDTLIILYGDTPFIEEETIRSMIDKVEVDSNDVVVLGFNNEADNRYGRLVIDDNNNLNEIIEYKDASDAQRKISICNSGVMAIRGENIEKLISEINNNNAKGEYYLTDIVSISKNNGLKSSFIIVEEDEVLGVNTQYERSIAENKLQDRLRLKAMSEGVFMADHKSVYLQKNTKFGRNVVIHQNVVIGKNVEIGDNVEIKAFSQLEECVIGNNVVIGPYARIRPGTEIGEGAKIGNFVEIKKSLIDEGAKISHLTYIGDSEVGKNANIGAGTVTCNYDGYNKLKTVIGENVFVGSNTSLVAPVNIGKGAVIGAGSTVIKEVMENSITRNQMPQINDEGKALKYRENRNNKIES